MTTDEFIERVDVASPLPSVGPVGTFAGALLAGLLTALVAGTLLGWEVSGGAPAAVFAGSTLGVAGVAWVALTALRTAGREVRFAPDGFEIATFAPFGKDTDVVSVRYDEVDLVVRTSLTEDGATTAPTYVLLRSGGPPLGIEGVEDPRTFERAVAEHIAAPEEVARHVEDDYGNRRGVESSREFWTAWPPEEPLPSSPVVDHSGLPDSVLKFAPEEVVETTEERLAKVSGFAAGNGPGM